jgi:hypothetical protein
MSGQSFSGSFLGQHSRDGEDLRKFVERKFCPTVAETNVPLIQIVQSIFFRIGFGRKSVRFFADQLVLPTKQKQNVG